jgi:hypothetical protein
MNNHSLPHKCDKSLRKAVLRELIRQLNSPRQTLICNFEGIKIVADDRPTLTEWLEKERRKIEVYKQNIIQYSRDDFVYEGKLDILEKIIGKIKSGEFSGV